MLVLLVGAGSPLFAASPAGQTETLKAPMHLRHGDHALVFGESQTLLVAGAPQGEASSVVSVRFLGPNPEVRIDGNRAGQGGKARAVWTPKVATNGVVNNFELYPGITYHTDKRQMKRDFVVAPGADPGSIRMQYKGMKSLRIGSGGELRIRTPYGEWQESVPYVYQRIGGKRVEVPASYRLVGSNQVVFEVGSYDRDHELVIDPVLTFIPDRFEGPAR